ncbi:MAG: cupin domain-containing protein [Candidatus Baltobacteraceae bacterium]
MRSYFLAFAVLVALRAAAVTAAAGPVFVMPGQEHWVKQQGGFSMAVLYGNPSKPGFYAVRLKTGTNWVFPAHYHPGRENVTVISGVFYAGVGKKYDAKKLTAFPAGSFISLAPGLAHYAMTKAPAVIELTGTEPLKDVMVK